MQYAKKGQLDNIAFAKDLLLQGYTTQIVMMESNLSYKQVRNLINCCRIERKMKHSKLKCAHSYLSNYVIKLQVSILMQIYYSIGEKQIYSTLNVQDLNLSYAFYRELLYVHESPSSTNWYPLDINAAWVLANALKNNKASLKKCIKCKTNYYSLNDENTHLYCPFCCLKIQ